MQLQANQSVLLLDAQQRPLGQVTIEDARADLLAGRFTPGPAFAAVERLFRDFEEAVNSQALAVVDGLDAAIAALGLCLGRPDGSERMAVHDVQIWSDGGFTGRPGAPADAGINGGGRT